MDEMFVEFRKRREFLYDELISIKGITCYKPEGAFYIFPNISAFMHKHSNVLQVDNSFDFAMHLLYEAHIAVVPGNAFGADEYLRISYATSMENLKEAVIRLKKALAKLEV